MNNDTQNSLDTVVNLIKKDDEKWQLLSSNSDQRKEFEKKLTSASHDLWLKWAKDTTISLGAGLGESILNKLPFIATMYAVMQHRGVISKEVGVELTIGALDNLSESIEFANEAPENAQAIIGLVKTKSHAGVQVSSKLAAAAPVLNALGIFASLLSVVVTGYELKKAVDETKNLDEYKQKLVNAFDQMQTLIPSEYLSIVGQYGLNLTRGQTRDKIKAHVGKFDQISLEELSVLIGKLNPDNPIDKVFIDEARAGLEGKISQSENPQAAADKASQIIGVSALQRAQRKINAASSKQDIIVAIKTFALVLAVAGLVASCLATAGIAPFALGVSLAVAGVAIAITSGVLNKSVATDKTRAKSSQQVAESEIGSFNFMRDLQSASGVSDESVQSVKDQMLDAYDIGEYDIIEDICSEYVKKHQSGDKDDKKAVKEIQDYRNELINDLSDRSSFRPD